MDGNPTIRPSGIYWRKCCCLSQRRKFGGAVGTSVNEDEATDNLPLWSTLLTAICFIQIQQDRDAPVCILDCDPRSGSLSTESLVRQPYSSFLLTSFCD